MASSRVEFGYRQSTPRTTTVYEKNSLGFLHSCIGSTNSGNTCADFESEIWKNQNSVDLSWLPDHIDIKRNGSTTASKSNNLNHSRETEDDSWLPSTSIVNGGDDYSWLPNYNDVKRNISTIPSKPNNLNRSRKNERGSNCSKFSFIHNLTNGDQSKETINNKKHTNLKNKHHSERALDQIQHAKPLNKKPESSSSQGRLSSSKSNCEVETERLGIPSANSGNTCAQNNVDLSWLPNYDDDYSASKSHHHNGEIEFHYSWLPDHIDIKRIGSLVASKSGSSNPSRVTETENDSWLPSTPIVNSENDDSWLPNYDDIKRNSLTIPSKPNNFNCSRKTEDGSNYSNQTKKTIDNKKHKNSKNQDHSEGAHEVVISDDQEIQHAKPLNKNPESSRSEGQVSSSISNCVVETDSLGGVSTLLRRFQVAGENKLRLIRGRQAFNNFLHLIEQDRQRELENLAKRKPVSQFSHRGRIQALLSFRFIQHDAEAINPAKEFIEKTLGVDASSPSTQGSNDSIQFESPHDWSSEYSQSQSDWDEEDDDDEEDVDDWISEIARPRRYWDCMRQARYHEMLHLYSHEEDLRQLLERRYVAGFLSSGLRENIDQLMASRAEGIELRKEDMEAEEDEDDWSRLERECREYNEFINRNQTTTLEERSNVIYGSYQSSSSSCEQVLISY